MRRLRQIRDDVRGAGVIELALVAPMFALLTIGIVDLSNAFARKLALEQAAHRAIEKVMQTTGTSTVEQTIIDEAKAQAGVTDDKVTVEYRLECSSDDGATWVKQGSYDGECPDTDKEARYLMVTVTDNYTPMFPVRFSGIDGGGVYNLSATAGLRTQ